MAFKAANARCEAYLIGTAYPTNTTNFATNLALWLKDRTQAGAALSSATQKWMALLANAANQ